MTNTNDHGGAEQKGMGDLTYLIFYEDADRRPEVYAGGNSKAGAYGRFEIISTNWNAHLFVKLKSNCPQHPDYSANAVEVSASDYAAMQSELTALKEDRDSWRRVCETLQEKLNGADASWADAVAENAALRARVEAVPVEDLKILAGYTDSLYGNPSDVPRPLNLWAATISVKEWLSNQPNTDTAKEQKP